MKKFLFSCSVAAAAFVAISPAQATEVPACLTDGSAPAAIDCRGYFAGNLISGNAGDRATQLTQIEDMGFVGSVPASLFSPGSPFLLTPLNGATTLSFPGAPMLYGDTFIGIHWGGQGGGRTAFYEFYFATPVSSVTIIKMNPGNSSNAVLYSTGTPPPAVPEPATWAMMIAGIATVGSMMRRRKVAVAFN